MLAGKTALITGATGGIGAAIARELAQNKCNLVINGFGERDQVETFRQELIATSGHDVVYDDADLEQPKAVERLTRDALNHFGSVDILINNAVVRDFAPIESFPPESWDRALSVNLSAAFHTTRLLLPSMRARGWGRIINMSSVFGFFACSNRVAYVTTKTALLGMTRAVALETAEQDITCNAICPGTVDTPAIQERIQELASTQDIDHDAATQRFLQTRQPGEQFVKAESVASLVSFLCSNAGQDITGTALPVDRGWNAC